MASKRETVLAAAKTLVAAALPGVEVRRNLAKTERIPPGGLVVIRDGDPGEPEVSLSPLTPTLAIFRLSPTRRIMRPLASCVLPANVNALLPESRVKSQIFDFLGKIGCGDRI